MVMGSNPIQGVRSEEGTLCKAVVCDLLLIVIVGKFKGEK
jgi:hypothetical protein